MILKQTKIKELLQSDNFFLKINKLGGINLVNNHIKYFLF